MKVDTLTIQAYPDELFKNYWVEWCESFLQEPLEINDEQLETFNLSSIPGIAQNSDPPSRALELFRSGVLLYPINVNGRKSQAWGMLSDSKSIISNFGYIAYLIAKTYLLENNTENTKLEKAFSALCSVVLIKQHFKFEREGLDISLSTNSVYQHLLESFESYSNDKIALQYIASGMICSIKEETFNEEFLNQILLSEKVQEFIITNNSTSGGGVRDRVNFSNISAFIEKIRTREISFNNTTNQRFCNFFVGNHSDSPERGFVNNSFKYFKDFLKECSLIEIKNFKENPFSKIYSNEKYDISTSPVPDVIESLKLVFDKYSSKPALLKDMMKTLEEGCIEALRVLNWSGPNSEIPIDLSINTKNIIFYGAPGTGKSFKVEKILSTVPNARKERVTFHPDYDNASFIGGYKPISEFDSNKNEFIVKYKFVPQIFTSIYVRAWNDPGNDYYLAIEEINRGNCAEIFGELFQLLDRNNNYSITPSKEMIEYLKSKLGEDNPGIRDGKMTLPPNLNLLATMNTSDQSLFPMDSAFKRRWSWEYVPISYAEINNDGSLNESYQYVIKVDDSTLVPWVSFIKNINEKIKSNPNLGMDKCIGNYFIRATNNEIDLEDFIHKVIFYLWNDVFKDEDNEVFPEGITYEDFFPISSNGAILLKKIFANIGLT